MTSMLADVVLGGQGMTPVRMGVGQPLVLMAGTCALESRETTFRTAEVVMKLGQKLGLGVVYKGSYDKANRTSLGGARGMGMDEGLALLQAVRQEFGCPVLTDVHETSQVAAVASVVDVLQVPAFLARQTDLLLACGAAVAAQPGKAVNIKKGQFMAPADMGPAAAKVASAWKEGGPASVILTERGTTFGYGDLVVDYRSFPTMSATGHPVVFDVTHSIMQPSGKGDASTGKREFALPLARAAVAVGVQGLFIETHPDPANAASDRDTQIPLHDLEAMLVPLVAMHQLRWNLVA